MVEYSAPVRDMQFVLEWLCDVRGLATLEPFAEFDAESLGDVLHEAGRFVGDVIAPTNREGDKVGSRRNADGTVTTPPGFKEAYRQWVDGGWAAAPFDPIYGGGGLPWAVAIAVSEMVTAANMAFSLCPMLSQGAIHMLGAHGSDEQKATYLPRLISGEWSGTMLLTEPQAGSDVGALTTRAVKQDDGTYRLFGQKIFITWGEQDFTDNIVHITLARTPDAPAGTRGISVFIVPKVLVGADGTLGARNDISCVGIEHKMGIHASPTCVMALGERDGAVGYLIGDEQEGMRNMFTMMNFARLSVGVEGLAVGERAYQQSVAFAHERRQSRAVGSTEAASPIIEHPDVRRMLLTMKAYVEAMRALCYVNAAAIDRGHAAADDATRVANQELADLLTPISKGWCTDTGSDVASLGIQVHGGMGFIEETGAAQHYRDVRIAAIYEGTNGIQAIDLVGRKLPMRDGAVVRELLATMRELDAELAATDLDDLRAPLTHAIDTIGEAAEWLLEPRNDHADVLAGATPFLRMAGLVAGGWLLARAAVIATQQRSETTDTDIHAFLDAKIATARFFVTQLLPGAAALLPAVTSGADQLHPRAFV
ncbi:MAG TPA: acyl-CoA dehydrogenase [Acidimicrobiales bacterium]|nr:acyl-CoA dehydrogenase [Acidimicrobiales bacterium]